MNETLKNKENAINSKNKILNENQQRIEMLLNNNKIWDLEKGKFNIELKSTQDKVEELEKNLKEKDEIIEMAKRYKKIFARKFGIIHQSQKFKL